MREIKFVKYFKVMYNKGICNVSNAIIQPKIRNLFQIILDMVVLVMKKIKDVYGAVNYSLNKNPKNKGSFAIINVIQYGEV